MWHNRLRSAWLFIVPVFILAGCASPRAPTGGDKDEHPPVLIEAESTPNQQTNFKEKEIIITFDEWFTLKNVKAQLVVSPLMPEEPEIKQKGKSIIINLPDSLKEETTYTINFGSSIADLNEGNVLENFAFVFSTGAILDSVFITGKVVSAVTLKPVADVLVMLHPINKDSAVYKDKPEYVSRTDKEGRWKLENIRLDSFRVVALLDGNLNFLYDLETELFGWYELPLHTNQPKILLPEIILFPKERKSAIRDVLHDAPGWLKVVVDGPKPLKKPLLIPPIDNVVTAWDGDTIHFWYSKDLDYRGEAVLNNDTSIVQAAKSTKAKRPGMRITNLTGKLPPFGTARLHSAIPFSSVDTSRITFVVDSSKSVAYNLRIDSLDPRVLLVESQWKLNTNHYLTFLPQALENVLGDQNDTIRTSVQVADLDAFGNLTIKVSGLDSTMTYLMNLKSGDKLIQTYLIKKLKNTVLLKKSLLPGKYSVELIEDINENGFWDTGDYQEKRQPERKMIFELESLRAAWEVESSITWQ